MIQTSKLLGHPGSLPPPLPSPSPSVSSAPRIHDKIPSVELPDRYNVGADLIERNLAAGRAAKIAIHSVSADLTYGDLHKLACGAARALPTSASRPRSASRSPATTAQAGTPAFSAH